MPTGLRVILHILQGIFLAAATLGGVWTFFFVTTVGGSEFRPFDIGMINLLIVSALVGIGFSPALWSVRRAPVAPSGPPVQPPAGYSAGGPRPGQHAQGAAPQEWPPR